MAVTHKAESYLNFIEVEPKAKTKVWEVWSRPEDEGGKIDGGGILGVVKFYGAWRCYAFYPTDNTVFDKSCLRTIATFCEAETSRWRYALRQKRRAR